MLLTASLQAVCEGVQSLPQPAAAGAPVSAVPGKFAALVRRGMETLKAVLAEGARAQVSTAAVCAATLRTVFFECFTSFALAMDKVRPVLLGDHHPLDPNGVVSYLGKH